MPFLKEICTKQMSLTPDQNNFNCDFTVAIPKTPRLAELVFLLWTCK